jgi:hypothetical protein
MRRRHQSRAAPIFSAPNARLLPSGRKALQLHVEQLTESLAGRCLVPGGVNDLDRPQSTMANETSEETVEIRRIEKS